jgi:peptidoglycan hydrolase-like protein with peptidoglycan-binding domain
VKDLQTRLTELGYYAGAIDGAYGNQTRRAVELFQYQNGLTPDGIAGRYTLTVLYESDEVKPAPTNVAATNTPPFHPDETFTPAPATATPEATPEPTVTPEPAPTPEPTATPDPNVPILLDSYDFVLTGFPDSLTAEGTDVRLHPVESEEALYVPLTEILKDTGSVVIVNVEDGKQEIAFSVLTDFYQVSYILGDDGSPGNLSIKKNAQLQPMITRNAILMDGILYLPMEDMERITGIGFTMDDAGGTITVTVPTAG